MQYILIKFEYGMEGTAYQEISNGVVIRYTDMDGNTIELPQNVGSHVIDPNPPRQPWMS